MPEQPANITRLQQDVTKSDAFAATLDSVAATKKDHQIAKLEAENQEIRDALKRHNFYFVFAFLIVVNAVSGYLSISSVIPVLLLTLLFLVIYGRECGIDDVYTISQNLIDKIYTKSHKQDQ